MKQVRLTDFYELSKKAGFSLNGHLDDNLRYNLILSGQNNSFKRARLEARAQTIIIYYPM